MEGRPSEGEKEERKTQQAAWGRECGRVNLEIYIFPGTAHCKESRTAVKVEVWGLGYMLWMKIAVSSFQYPWPGGGGGSV